MKKVCPLCAPSCFVLRKNSLAKTVCVRSNGHSCTRKRPCASAQMVIRVRANSKAKNLRGAHWGAHGGHTFCRGVPPLSFCYTTGYLKRGRGGTPFSLFCIKKQIFYFVTLIQSASIQPRSQLGIRGRVSDSGYRVKEPSLAPATWK